MAAARAYHSGPIPGSCTWASRRALPATTPPGSFFKRLSACRNFDRSSCKRRSNSSGSFSLASLTCWTARTSGVSHKGIHLIKNPSATERARAIDRLVAEKAAERLQVVQTPAASGQRSALRSLTLAEDQPFALVAPARPCLTRYVRGDRGPDGDAAASGLARKACKRQTRSRGLMIHLVKGPNVARPPATALSINCRRPPCTC